MPTPALHRAIQFLEALNEIEDEMRINVALILLRVASKPSLYQREVTKFVPVTKSAAGRMVDHLSDRGGLGLINAREDFEDRRINILTLTARGQETVRRLLAQL
ncbi:hypothetical protein [Bosea sp. (in: a-proteobacteria)]|jgi:DNA-binding MarR family transcriptional regulator|uniref:hypothetical protein n=1 Tax=Bosea sp. (in: a-proteobacteria) TaxID=1871050 RepID=UPI002DDD02BC|nr:hypothetical protein [Bosea sp. (in: a-proteobacteria)]HEV2509686.1 hypothetical protein [Bosea sp. (in: a-proteobacteria)]